MPIPFEPRGGMGDVPADPVVKKPCGGCSEQMRQLRELFGELELAGPKPSVPRGVFAREFAVSPGRSLHDDVTSKAQDLKSAAIVAAVEYGLRVDEIKSLRSKVDSLTAENVRLKMLVDALADRCSKQSDLLSKSAEKVDG